MSFSGKFEVQSHENFEPFAKAFGLPSEFIEKYRDLKTIYEIVQNGKKFKFTATTGSTAVTNEFTIGEEGELDIPTGEKMKAVSHMEGDNKLVTVAKEKNMTAVTEINGDTLTTVYRMGDIQYKRTSKRI